MSKKTENDQFEESGRRVTTIVSLISVSYFVCWLPWNISIWLNLASFGRLGNILQTMVVLPLKYANHFMNPIICILASEKFRNDAKELFGCLDEEEDSGTPGNSSLSRRGTIFSAATSWKKGRNVSDTDNDGSSKKGKQKKAVGKLFSGQKHSTEQSSMMNENNGFCAVSSVNPRDSEVTRSTDR